MQLIHYHGTPISGAKLDEAKFLTGRHALVSYHHPTTLPAVTEFCQSFVLDNGAFSFWREGRGAVDVEVYYEWVLSLHRHPAFDWCLIPDKIDGTEHENVLLYEQWQAMATGICSVPIWHLHESLDWLKYLAENNRIVAFGSSGEWASVGTQGWWGRMADALRAVCDEYGRPMCKLHGLRMLDPAIFTRIPLHSADSANAGINAGSVKRFGMYTPATAGQRAQVIADRIELHNSPSTWEGSKQMVINL